MKYVAYAVEHLRDGHEESAKVVPSIADAMKFFERVASGFGGCNSEFALFELGKQIPIADETTEIPGPVQKVRKFRVK